MSCVRTRGSLIVGSILVAAACGGETDVTVIRQAAAAPPPQQADPPAAGRSAASPPANPGVVLIRGVPFVKQQPGFSGEACVEMALRRLGHRVTQDQVFAIARVDPSHGRGANAAELAAALERMGFEVGQVFHRVSARPGRRQRLQLRAQLQALLAELRAGTPQILGLRTGGGQDHFVLALGYDPADDELIVHDPALERGASRRVGRAQLLAALPRRLRRERWVTVRLRLEPKAISVPVVERRSRHSPADFARHVMRLRPTLARLEGRFAIVVQPPFVMIGDSGRRDVRYIGRALVKRAVDSFKALYFKEDPLQILNIWLFKGRRSYLTNTIRLTGEHPGTPFGFYSSRHRALVMNIKTGGGTLVHELVHPFVEANFPDCPPWFNEGLGSLYEGVGWPGGKIRGYKNWRLPGLKEYIRRRSVPSFKALMAQNELQFYERDPGTNYAQSRYLLYYLQEQGLLRSYYHAFHNSRRTDPTGYETLKKLLKLREDQVPGFQRQWQAFVMKLRWRGR